MLVSSGVLHQLLSTLTQIHYEVNEAAHLTAQPALIVPRCPPTPTPSCISWHQLFVTAVLILGRRTIDPWEMIPPPQVPNSALPFWKAPPAAAVPALHQPFHHRGGVFQEDHRQRPHHEAPLGHVQVKRHLNPPPRPSQENCQITAGVN